MAVESTLVKTTLTLKYKDGIDLEGKDVMKTKKFSNVRVNAQDQNILDTAVAFEPLMMYPNPEVYRTDDSMLINA